jgi:asparagine synthase (glutamine-hydrolysing)
MCGIAGIIAFNEQAKQYLPLISKATTCLSKRGPDAEGIYTDQHIALGHRRLSVIDTSNAAAQPMTDATERYTIVFNGEIFNYNEHREKLIQQGVQLTSHSDTEVLLHLYINEGAACLAKLNGFFAIAIYNKLEDILFVARDRMGVKPLYVYQNADRFVFASEMKAMLAMDIPKELDYTSLAEYLQLNYIPAPHSIFKDVKKLEAGTYLIIQRKQGLVEKQRYYQIPYSEKENTTLPYQAQQKQLVDLLNKSIERRLVADVPVGAFLSGGIDSSVVVALAAEYTKHLQTFSIGYKDEPLFDETKYANIVAERYKTEHTAFMLSNADLYESLFDVLDYTDEPFADSSALAVYILSKHTRNQVTVALSGDGADELFGGYNKHRAEYFLRNNTIKTKALQYTGFIWDALPKSRNTWAGNKVRQLHRFAEGASLSASERYWRWCAFTDEQRAFDLLKSPLNKIDYTHRKSEILQGITNSGSFNEVLLTDTQLVLQNDMLTKVDMMSMANGLEVRSPFLDYEIVNFAFTLPVSSKIDTTQQKKILRDTFRSQLPPELFNRPKKGFEVPLLNWFNTELRSLITDDLLNDDYIEAQGIFNVEAVKALKKQLFSNSPQEATARTWGLIVFQYWYKKHFV